MTNLTITFTSPGVIHLDPTGTISYQIDVINADQTITNIVASTSISGEVDVTLATDGIYKVSNLTDAVAETVNIFNNILSKLQENVQDILLNGQPQTLYPNNYDFVLLSLMSMLVIGNSTYQIVTYSAGNLAAYAQIAKTYDQTTKYLDIINNTAQSTNALLD